MTDAAHERRFQPIYIDLWQHRRDPLTAINYALQEGLDDLAVPRSAIGKRLKTNVKKFALAGAALDCREEPARRRPAEPTLLVDWPVRQCAVRAQRPLLLLFDEIQERAHSDMDSTADSALRTALTKNGAHDCCARARHYMWAHLS
jgi:hypothetical protein